MVPAPCASGAGPYFGHGLVRPTGPYHFRSSMVLCDMLQRYACSPRGCAAWTGRCGYVLTQTKASYAIVNHIEAYVAPHVLAFTPDAMR